MIKQRATNIIKHAIKYKGSEWNFNNVMEKYGADNVIYFARMMLDRFPPPSGAEKWIKDLYEEHKDNPVKRYAIATGMIHTAIDCKIYEIGWRSLEEVGENFDKI